MSYDEFVTDGDKPYAENLNDALLLLDAFDVTVPCKMPDMFSNGQFSSTTEVERKCGVAIVTLKSVASGVTVGTSSISGTGAITFRVYPNFNSFYKWKSIVLDMTGTVAIGFKKADGTTISATVASDGTISDASALKELAPIDVTLTLTSATINSILISFINNQGTRARTGALIEADQLVNVNGTITSGNDKAVSGGTVYTALDTLSDVVDGKESLSNKVTSLDNSDSHYPSSKAVKTVTDAKENTSNKVTTLDASNTHYPSCSAVFSGLSMKEDVGNKDSEITPTTLEHSTHYPTMSIIKKIVQWVEDLADISCTVSSTTESGRTWNITIDSNLKNAIIVTIILYLEDTVKYSNDYLIQNKETTLSIVMNQTNKCRIKAKFAASGNVIFDKTYSTSGNVIT